MKFCTECGTKADFDEQKFCKVCGHKSPEAAPAPQPDLRPGAAAPGCAALQPRRRNPCRVCPLDGLAIGPLSLAATRGVSRLISSPPGT